MRYQQDRTRRRKDEILRAAAQVFNQKGYNDAMIEEIADRLEYTKGSIYYYVKGKQELFYECSKRAFEALNTELDAIRKQAAPPAEQLRAAVNLYLVTALDEFSVLPVGLEQEFVLQEDYRAEIVRLRAHFEEGMLAILEEGARQGVFDMPDKRISLFLLLGSASGIKDWYARGGDLPLEELTEAYSYSLLAPFLSEDEAINEMKKKKDLAAALKSTKDAD